MSQPITKIAKSKPGKKAGTQWKTMMVRAHIPALVEEVKGIFQADHNVTPTTSDVLTNALNAYKQKLMMVTP